jgi:hypothetical protein
MNEPSNEKVFYKSGNVLVSNTRVIIDNKMYAVNNITSVELLEKGLSMIFYVLLLVGIICLISGLNQNDGLVLFLFLSVLSFIGSYLIWKYYPRFAIILRTSGVENEALTSINKQFALDVIKAINDAIIHRG